STSTGPGVFAGEVMADQRSATAIDQHIAKRMRLRRIEIGMSQERLAQMLGTSFQQVQKYEWGANRISASRLLDVSTALRLPVEHFFEGLGVEAGKAGDPNVIATLATPEGIELARMFAATRDQRVRLQILQVVFAATKE